MDPCQIQGILCLLASLNLLLRAYTLKQLGSGTVVQGNRGYILIIPSGHQHSIVDQADKNVRYLGSCVIYHCRNPEGRPITQRLPVYGGASICTVGNVVFRRQGKGKLHLVSLLHAPRLETCPDVQACIHPLLIIGVIVGSRNTAIKGLCKNLPILAQVLHLVAGSCSVSNGCKVDVADLIPIHPVDGVAFGHIMRICHHRVAAEVILSAWLTGIGNKEAVAADAVVGI